MLDGGYKVTGPIQGVRFLYAQNCPTPGSLDRIRLKKTNSLALYVVTSDLICYT